MKRRWTHESCRWAEWLRLLPPSKLSRTPTPHPLTLLRRHVSGDWGDLCREDIEANRLALAVDARILSADTLSDETKVWVITEADRSATTILLPSDY